MKCQYDKSVCDARSKACKGKCTHPEQNSEHTELPRMMGFKPHTLQRSGSLPTSSHYSQCVLSVVSCLDEDDGGGEEEGEEDTEEQGEEDFEVPQVVSFDVGSAALQPRVGMAEGDEEGGGVEGDRGGRSRSNSEGSSVYGKFRDFVKMMTICSLTPLPPSFPPLLSPTLNQQF